MEFNYHPRKWYLSETCGSAEHQSLILWTSSNMVKTFQSLDILTGSLPTWKFSQPDSWAEDTYSKSNKVILAGSVKFSVHLSAKIQKDKNRLLYCSSSQNLVIAISYLVKLVRDGNISTPKNIYIFLPIGHSMIEVDFYSIKYANLTSS